MHRADLEIVERIERAYIEHGYRPCIGSFISEEDQLYRCGLGALMDSVRMPCQSLVDRASCWCAGFTQGFDAFGDSALGYSPDNFVLACMNPHIFYDCLGNRDINLDYALKIARGYRAGWSCAKRVFAKPPVERIPEYERPTIAPSLTR